MNIETSTPTPRVSANPFTAEEASQVVRQLNYGALPVPIELLSTETVGASLGDAALKAGLHAGLVGFALLALFMVLWYRLPGFIAAAVKVTGLAGFILSIGMAVDANVLIFERMKEEHYRCNNRRDV